MDIKKQIVRKAWTVYLVIYAAWTLWNVLLWTFFKTPIRVPLSYFYPGLIPQNALEAVSLSLDVAAATCLLCYVRQKAIPGRVWRYALIAFMLLFAARAIATVCMHIKLIMDVGVSWWTSVVLGANISAASLFQIPMIVALISYAMKNQECNVGVCRKVP